MTYNFCILVNLNIAPFYAKEIFVNVQFIKETFLLAAEVQANTFGPSYEFMKVIPVKLAEVETLTRLATADPTI